MKNIARIFAVAAMPLTVGTAMGQEPQEQWVVEMSDGSQTVFDIAAINQMFIRKVTFEYVDLGLSVKWATCNVGAAAPEEYGDYFAWGETKPYYSSLDPLTWKNDALSGYCSDSYFDTNDGGSTFVKYTFEGTSVLAAEDDAAYVNWGSDWRMPTIAECEELCN